MRGVTGIENELEGWVEDLGYELVELRWGGSGQRPFIKLRIDHLDSVEGQGVTVDDCAVVSRALEPRLDDREGLSERYVLEVSSPGLERPLVRSRDFERFKGKRVSVKGHDVLLGRARQLDGQLLGLEDAGTDGEAVVLRLADGDELRIPRSEIRKAHLVFKWK